MDDIVDAEKLWCHFSLQFTKPPPPNEKVPLENRYISMEKTLKVTNFRGKIYFKVILLGKTFLFFLKLHSGRGFLLSPTRLLIFDQ